MAADAGLTEAIERLELMTAESGTRDLSDNDMAAISTVLADRARLEGERDAAVAECRRATNGRDECIASKHGLWLALAAERRRPIIEPEESWGETLRQFAAGWAQGGSDLRQIVREMFQR